MSTRRVHSPNRCLFLCTKEILCRTKPTRSTLSGREIRVSDFCCYVCVTSTSISFNLLRYASADKSTQALFVGNLCTDTKRAWFGHVGNYFYYYEKCFPVALWWESKLLRVAQYTWHLLAFFAIGVCIERRKLAKDALGLLYANFARCKGLLSIPSKP